MELKRVMDDLKEANRQESLQEQAALLLRLPQRMDAINAKLRRALERMVLPSFAPKPTTAVQLPAALPQDPKTHVCCPLTCAMSGESMGSFYAEKNRPWLDAVPSDQVCQLWRLTSFNLMQGTVVVFPRPRLGQMVPANQDIRWCSAVNVKMVIGKACPGNCTCKPQPKTSPLHEFCELQTLLLTEADNRYLKDLQFRVPKGRLAKTLGTFL